MLHTTKNLHQIDWAPNFFFSEYQHHIPIETVWSLAIKKKVILTDRALSALKAKANQQINDFSKSNR